MSEPPVSPSPAISNLRDAAEAQQQVADLTRMLELFTGEEVNSLLRGDSRELAQAFVEPTFQRTYLEHLSDGFALVGRDEELIYRNGAFARLFDLEAPLPGFRLLAAPHLAGCAPLAEALHAALHRHTSAHVEFSLVDEHGEQRYLALAATAAAADLTGPQAVLVVRDETQRAQTLAHLRGLNTVAEALSQSLDVDRLLPAALAACRAATTVDAALLFLLAPGDTALQFSCGDGLSAATLDFLAQHPLPVGQDPAGHVAADGQPRSILDARQAALLYPALFEQEGLVSAAFAPLRGPQGVSGVLCGLTRSRRRFTQADLQLLTSMGSQVGLALHNARLLAELSTQARTDALTGLLNRRAFMEAAEREHQRARRHTDSLAVLMIDLNDFKLVNDRHGHAAGDQMLQAVAQHLTTHIRTIDLVGRYGGDEFVVLLPSCDAEAARQVAQRLETGDSSAAPGSALTPDLSIGCAIAPPGSDAPLEKLLSLADADMYRDKAQKKSRRPAS